MTAEEHTETELTLKVGDLLSEPFIDPDLSKWAQATANRSEPCRVYWGTHGCKLERGHDGPHVCDCAEEDKGQFDPETREYYDEPGVVNVGAPPYYGPETTFYGEDATPQERGEA